ncbi:thiamine pyrophosphate-binding protein [Salinispora arenicola]|uniref:thiamine pyrophosphate-binding protein n=1 Tax=Salinispora arenicola TaxID=168697 RepID=UPI0027DAD2FD|nr:thiamine pyrophosphate-binding protein [Salinispora arenicola]
MGYGGIRARPRFAQRVIEVLQAYGVQYIFGVPGAKVDAMYDALADGGPRLIVCRHEQNAAFMAAAVGRLTGIPGAVLVTSGPGTANLSPGYLNGVDGAGSGHRPLRRGVPRQPAQTRAAVIFTPPPCSPR